MATSLWNIRAEVQRARLEKRSCFERIPHHGLTTGESSRVLEFFAPLRAKDFQDLAQILLNWGELAIY
jgi:hypothetical protein